jgi:predicted 2-oxoglutarate/Fe(II)-dependent dioxygenase YbiX
MDEGTREAAEVLDGDFFRADDIRRASHVAVPEAVLLLIGACFDARRDAIGAYFGSALSSREGLSLLRYGAGDFYRPHVDRATAPSWPGASRRAVTAILFLAGSRDRDPEGFTGGVLRLFPEPFESSPVEIAATSGTLVAFPADVLHEVTPVIDGYRDTAVDWFRSSRRPGPLQSWDRGHHGWPVDQR